MAKFITKDEFRKRFSLQQRVITTVTGDVFKVTQLNLAQKRSIREENMTLKFGIGKGADRESSAQLDVEGMMLDTIIAACVEPKFTSDDKNWMEEGIDAACLQDLYEKIETPVKLADLNDKEAMGNSKSS